MMSQKLSLRGPAWAVAVALMCAGPLAAADIPLDSDLEIICGSGAVVILEADLLDDLPDDLRELFDELGIHPEVVREVMRNGGATDGR